MNSTKKSIIKKSIKLFNNFGFHITTKDIIEHCKVSNGSFFYHFPKKETLTNDILNFIIHDFNETLEKLIKTTEPEDYKDRIHFIYTHIVKWGIDKPDYFLFLIQMKNQTNELKEEDNLLFKTLFRYIADIEYKHRFKDFDLTLLTNIGISIIAHHILFISKNKENKKSNSINEFYTIFIDAISK